jgi:diadenosine tetraphosphate (Ap4A) HIT family hydrolase
MIREDRVIEADDHAYAVLDAYPVSPGHTLIIVRRHVEDVFELERKEFESVVRLTQRLDRAYQPNGYNIGVNVGQAAGQTIIHVHFHVIPRYLGDSVDPTGGVRNVIPGRGRYGTDHTP